MWYRLANHHHPSFSLSKNWKIIWHWLPLTQYWLKTSFQNGLLHRFMTNIKCSFGILLVYTFWKFTLLPATSLWCTATWGLKIHSGLKTKTYETSPLFHIIPKPLIPAVLLSDSGISRKLDIRKLIWTCYKGWWTAINCTTVHTMVALFCPH